MEDHKFWSTQPVGLCDKKKFIPGVIHSHIDPMTIHKSPIQPPKHTQWCEIDLSSQTDIETLQTFLSAHYVEDADHKLRLLYTTQFLKWFLPQGNPGWCVFLKSTKEGSEEGEEGKIVGFISAVKREMLILGKTEVVAEVNLLCVHKDFRSSFNGPPNESDNRLAPILISEITRRINLDNIFVAIYTSGTLLPQKPFHITRYFHKFLNLTKLNTVGFSNFPQDGLEHAIQLYQHHSRVLDKLSDIMYLLRPMKNEEDDLSKVVHIFAEQRYVINEKITVKKLQSLLSCSIFKCFIIEKVDKTTRKREIVGFISVYDLDSMVLQDGVPIDEIKGVNIYYHCGPVDKVMHILFSSLQKDGKDVVNAVVVGNETIKFVKEELMLEGTGILNYYLYNYRLPVIGSNDLSYLVF